MNITKLNEIPDISCFFILTEISIPGTYDTYGDISTEAFDIQVFNTEEEWMKEINRMSNLRGYYYKRFKIGKFIPANITNNIQVNINGK